LGVGVVTVAVLILLALFGVIKAPS